MDQQRLLFEYNPAFILLCIALGLGYAYLLYSPQPLWNKRVNRMLFVLRTVTVTLLAFLLMGPILKLIINEYEKPTLVVLIDNSLSVGETVDSVQWKAIDDQINSSVNQLRSQGFDVQVNSLDGPFEEKIIFDRPVSDLTGAAKGVVGQFEGKNLAGLVVFSDGIYNSGSSPLYTTWNVPVYTVGLGDTTQRVDLKLKSLLYNKIAYQGNRFPLRAEVGVQGIEGQDVQVLVFQNGKLIAKEKKNSGTSALLDFDFEIEASQNGMQRVDVSVEVLGQEQNKKNNRASAYVEVVEGKKKVLLVSAAPHPDHKALGAVVGQNANYEFILHIPGVKEAPAETITPGNIDMAIFHGVDFGGKTSATYNTFIQSTTPVWLILGERTNLRQLAANGIPVTFENAGQWDEATPLLNPVFKDFGFSDNLNATFVNYPPAEVPFGKFTYPADASILLFQRIGRVDTERPLLFTTSVNDRKMAVLIGEGIWRWRLNEFASTQKTAGFDEVFGKLIQYLSTREDKRKFRSFSLQNEFSTAEPVVFESQVYNELYEPVYGNKIEIQLTGEDGNTYTYSYTTGPGSSRYRIGGLKEGVYQYQSSTRINGAKETVGGEFTVRLQDIEMQSLTADFGLLRKWAENTGGKFFALENLSELKTELSLMKVHSLIHSQESFKSLINLKLAFYLLLLLISAEWFARKYMGGY